MKKLILPLVMGLMLGSCSRDNEENIVNNPITPPVETPILPTEMVEEDGGERIVTTFNYDIDKLKEIQTKSPDNDWSKYSFTYSGDDITKIVMTESNGDKAEYNFVYQNGKLVSANYVHNESDYENRANITYTHNNDGTISINERVSSTNSQDANYRRHKNATTILTFDANQDITKIAFTEENDHHIGDTKITTQYDTKFSPFKNIKGLNPLIYDIVVDITEFSKYAKISQRRESNYTPKQNLSSPSRWIENTTYTNEYNANGYPSKITELEEQYSNGIPNSTKNTTITFSYNK